MSRLRFISQVLYRLKRRYGGRVDIVTVTSSSVDRETGRKTVTKSVQRVNRMIVLPSLVHKEFVYDLTFIASNKNFTYGGQFDTSQRRFIVDTRDLPTDFEIKPEMMYFLYDGRRYDVKQAERFEESRAWAVIGKQDISVPVETVHEVHLISEISLTSETEGTIA